MLLTLSTAIATFVATSIDYLVILVVFFAQDTSPKRVRAVVLGQYLGTGLLVAVSLLAAYGVSFIPQEWVIGLLGLIPIALGIRAIFKREEEQEEEEVLESAERYPSLVLAITLITIASGGDNIGVYVPLFSTLTPANTLLTLLVYALLVAVLCFTSYRLARIKAIGETIEKYERILVPLVLIALGVMILFENGTFAKLVEVLG